MNNASPTNFVAAPPLRTTHFNSGSQEVQDDEHYHFGQHLRQQGEDDFSEKEYSVYDSSYDSQCEQEGDCECYRCNIVVDGDHTFYARTFDHNIPIIIRFPYNAVLCKDCCIFNLLMESLPDVGFWLDEVSLSSMLLSNKEAKDKVEACRRRKLIMQGALLINCPQCRALTNFKDMIRTNPSYSHYEYQVHRMFSGKLLCSACHSFHLGMGFLPEICAWLDTVSLSRLSISHQAYKKTVSPIFKSRGRRLPILWEASETEELPHFDSSGSQGAPADIMEPSQIQGVDPASLALNTAGQSFSFLNVEDERMLKAVSSKHSKLLQKNSSCNQIPSKSATTHTPSCDDSRIGSESPSFWKITARSSEDNDFSAALRALFVR